MPALQSPQALLRAAGLRAKKAWGQNFLCDQAVLQCIADASECGPQRPVVELGAGLGALTYELLCRGAQVVAVERDRDLAPLLQDYLGVTRRLTVCEADAARFDYAALRKAQDSALCVVGNLPYQLSGRILVSLAAARGAVQSAVLLLQEEVAERLVAEPPGRAYGLLSVLVQRPFTAEILLRVPPEAFFPVPKVNSAVVRLRCRQSLNDDLADKQLVGAARAAFAARRKTLRNALIQGLGISSATALAALDEAALAAGARAETLLVEDFARLGAALANHGVAVKNGVAA